MKRRVLLQELQMIAKNRGLSLDLIRHGANHDLYEVGIIRLTVPRHGDINEITASRIIREAKKA